MSENPAPNELGFVEFAAKLISEMFDAVVTAQFDQEKRLAELAAAAAVTVEEFGEQYVTDEQIAAELEELFPGDSSEQPVAVYLGAPYRPGTKQDAELPPIAAVLGLKLVSGDYTTRDKQTFLAEKGYNKVLALVRGRLAQAQLSTIKHIVRNGFPRVIVDAGKVNAKLTYEVLSSEDAVQPERVKRLAAPLGRLQNIAYIPKSSALANFRLVVRQADDRAPQASQLKVNVYGEVEISFKTIV
ncbi:MAG TPA: hypothetical protein VIR78_09425 [Malonomonas sp.]